MLFAMIQVANFDFSCGGMGVRFGSPLLPGGTTRAYIVIFNAVSREHDHDAIIHNTSCEVLTSRELEIG